MDYVKYWGLETRPFENTRNPRFFFRSPVHLEALRRLLYVVRSGNKHFAVLTGEIGSGKTTTRTVLEKGLSPESYVVVSLENSNQSFPFLLSDVIAQMRGERRREKVQSSDAIYDIFKDLLYEKCVLRDRELVIVLDEAQQISDEALIEFKNLTNCSTEDRNFVNVILVGQPELRFKVAALPQIDQRVSLRFHLSNLREEDVRSYIVFRLKAAGHPTGEVFSEKCYRIIHMATKGVPREINRLCELSLELGFAAEATQIKLSIIRTLIMDLMQQKGALQQRMAS